MASITLPYKSVLMINKSFDPAPIFIVIPPITSEFSTSKSDWDLVFAMPSIFQAHSRFPLVDTLPRTMLNEAEKLRESATK